MQVLPPYAKSKNSEWYKGTANAIYQNIRFIERYNPDNVLILSGDHIYKMDYAAMLRFHEQQRLRLHHRRPRGAAQRRPPASAS